MRNVPISGAPRSDGLQKPNRGRFAGMELWSRCKKLCKIRHIRINFDLVSRRPRSQPRPPRDTTVRDLDGTQDPAMSADVMNRFLGSAFNSASISNQTFSTILTSRAHSCRTSNGANISCQAPGIGLLRRVGFLRAEA